MGIKFKGIHSNSLGRITWKTTKRPFLPTSKVYTDSAPEADSEYDYSEFNEDGRLHYHDRVFEGTLTAVNKSFAGLQYALTSVARWLIGGWGELIFDDMPDTVWQAKIENVEQISYELGKIGTATVYFRVKPFSKWIFDSIARSISVDSPVSVDCNISLEFAGVPDSNFTDGAKLNILNLGDFYTKPVIEVKGNFNWVELTCGGKSIRCNAVCANETITFNSHLMIVEKNGEIVNSSGKFFELSPGNNEVQIRTDGSGQVKFIFDYRFIYGAVI